MHLRVLPYVTDVLCFLVLDKVKPEKVRQSFLRIRTWVSKQITRKPHHLVKWRKTLQIGAIMFSYVSAMVPVKTMRDYDMVQEVHSSNADLKECAAVLWRHVGCR